MNVKSLRLSTETEIAGVQYNNLDGSSRRDVIKLCGPNERLALKREPNNPHDKNAVAVCRQSGQQLGYLWRALAAKVAPLLDAGAKGSAKIRAISESEMKIRVDVYGGILPQRSGSKRIACDPWGVCCFGLAPPAAEDEPPTERQIQYAMCLGITDAEAFTKSDLSLMIDTVKRKLNLPPSPGQRDVAGRLGIQLPDSISTARECREFLFQHADVKGYRRTGCATVLVMLFSFFLFLLLLRM